MNRCCVVFDIDDTLYLEREYVRSGYRAAAHVAAAEFGLPDFAQRAWRLFQAGIRTNVFDRVLVDAGVPHSRGAIDRLVAVYRSHIPRIRMLDDARACLEHLRGRCPSAVISDGPVESQSAKVHALRLHRYAQPVVLTDHWGTEFRKPHPRAFEYLESSVPAERYVYVADNPAKDFAAPHARGWSTVRIRRNGGLHSDVPSTPVEVSMELNTLSALPEWLELT